MSANHKQPYTYAPYETSHVIVPSDFKSVAALTYQNVKAEDMSKAQYTAAIERKHNQTKNYQIDPPFKIWLNEKQLRQRDAIKSKFAHRRGHRNVSPKRKVARPVDTTKPDLVRKPPVPRQKFRVC